MSRFNFFIITIVCACCLFTVACEKENFAPTGADHANEFSVEEIVPTSPGFTGERAEVKAAEVLAQLREAPVFAAATTHIAVTSKRPTSRKLHYVDGPPAVESAADTQAARLEIDCPYGDCADTIPAMVERYQDIATAQCNDQYLCVSCCADGATIYVVIHIEADCLPARRR